MADHYCLIADVNALVPQALFTATSRPTDAQVIVMIDQVAQRMDASMSNVGYVVPVVTGTKALGLLREACAWGTVGLAQLSRGTQASVGLGDRFAPAGDVSKNVWTRMFDEWLKKLLDPQDPFELPDAARTNEQIQKQPDQVLRSFVQGVTDDVRYDPNKPVCSRYQVL
jgi:hypothetical protein